MGAPMQTAARTPLGLQGAYCGPPWLFRWIRSPWVTTAGSEPDAGMDFGSLRLWARLGAAASNLADRTYLN